MNRIAFILTLLFAFALQVQAQNPNGKITSGVIAFDAGRIDEAFEKLSFAADNIDLVKEKNVPKMHYYLAKTYLALYADSTQKANHPDALQKADMHLRKVKETDASGKYSKLILLDENTLWANLFNDGATMYSAQEYTKAKANFELAKYWSSEDINTHLMLGYSQFMLQDTTNALGSWEAVTSLYDKELKANAEEGTEAEPNKQVATAYLMLATLYDLGSESQKALDLVARGRELFPLDEDLRRTELSIYQKNPELFDQAVEKFESAIKDNPEDTQLKLAYGNLLAQNGQSEKALNLFQEVYEQDSESLVANQQLAIYYINSAADISSKKMDESDENKIDEMDVQIKENMSKAYPFLEKLRELQPEEPEWINQMISAAYYMELPDEEINKLMEEQKAIMGNN